MEEGLQTSYEDLDALLARRAPRNPKGHDQRAFDASMERFGFVAPVLIDDTDGSLAEGHGRVETLSRMRAAGAAAPRRLRVDADGAWQVPTFHVRLGPGQADAYRIAANRIGELGGWNESLLSDVLEELQQQTAGLSGVGFSRADVDRLAATLAREATPRPSVEEIPAKRPAREARLRQGDLVRLGEHRLLVGDATKADDVRRAVGPALPSCLWTDPPYGLDYTGRTKDRLTILNDERDGVRTLLAAAFAAVDEVLEAGSPLYVFRAAGPLSIVATEEFCRVGWSLRQELIWLKSGFVLSRSDYMYRHEPLLYGFKPGTGRLGRPGPHWHGGNDASSVFEVPRPSASPEHPTAKPVRLAEQMLRNSTTRGATVIDPFAGSGPALIACELLGRRFVGLEIDPCYAQVAAERWERFSGRPMVVEAR